MAERTGAELRRPKQTVLIAFGVAALATLCLFWSLAAPQSDEDIAYRVATDSLVKRYRAYQPNPFYLLPRQPGAVYRSSDWRGKPLVAVKGTIELDENGRGIAPLALRRLLIRAAGRNPAHLIDVVPVQWYVYLRQEADGTWTLDTVQVGEGTIYARGRQMPGWQ